MAQMLLDELLKGSKTTATHRRIIAHFMNNGSTTIPELSKELNLSVPTIAKVVAEMCEGGFIMGYGKMDTGKGRSPAIYGLSPDSGYFVGVDMKKDGLNIGLMNFNGEMVKLDMDVPYRYENTQQRARPTLPLDQRLHESSRRSHRSCALHRRQHRRACEPGDWP